jgi:hypothetical protein
LLAFHAANIGSQLDNRQRISPDSGITGVSRLELNLRRPHRSAVVVAAEVIGFDFAVREGFLASWATQPREPNMTASLAC